MGLLGIPTRKDAENLYKKISNTNYKKDNFSNQKAVENLIRYVTRTRKDEMPGREWVLYDAVGAINVASVDDIIQQFLFVQHAYGIEKRGGRRMYHEVFNLMDEEVAELGFSLQRFWQLGMGCAQIYYGMGFQVVFAVHWEYGKHFHIHFAVNGISYINGHKWHTSLNEIHQREELFNRILYNCRAIPDGKTAAIYFQDVPMIGTLAF